MSSLNPPLPPFKYKTQQQQIFPNSRTLVGPGAARFFTGDFFEEATYSLFPANRHNTDSKCLNCPDLQIDKKTFIECKAVGNTNHLIVYSSRLKKDIAFCRKYKVTLYYAMWRHTAKVLNITDLEELQALLASKIHALYIVRVQTINDILRDRPERIVNKAIPYRMGWTLGLHEIKNYCRYKKDSPLWMKVYGVNLKPFTIHYESNKLTKLI